TEEAPSDGESESIEPAPRLEDVEDIDFDLFLEAWTLIEEQFDGKVPSNEEILFSAIEGSLETLGDENTRFVRPDVAARMREDAGGSVEGIGAFVRETDDGLFEIVRPIAGQPAEAAGLLPGDIVLAVDGELTENYSFDEIILRVRGPRGTDVTLTILREGVEEPIDFTITRVRFELATVEFEMLEGNIAYIKLATFLDPTATEKVAEALQTLLDQGAESVIFDLRDDPGGFLNQSISVADLFLPDSVVLLERNNAGLDRVFRADDGDLGEEVPLVVLINGGSASASEIVAGAIQDNDRGVLIGEVTFGKGSVQNIFELSDGSEMRVTIARFYSPDNNIIHGVGITPDIIVEMAFDAEEDIQLLRAIEYLQTGE
ncbi:Tail-specific protease precursor, partial [hydrothermal vent metagenome]